MSITASSDHVARGLQKVLSQWGNSPKIRALLASYIKPIQAAETFASEVLSVLSINAGSGIVLDRIGVIVGRGRNGLADDDYRYALRAQVRINRSCGKVEDFIEVLSLSLNNDPAYSVACKDAGIAAGQVTLHGAAPATVIQVLWQSARAVKMAGVRLHFVFSVYDGDSTFAFAPTPVGASVRETSETKGFGWSGDASLGGHFAGEFAT